VEKKLSVITSMGGDFAAEQNKKIKSSKEEKQESHVWGIEKTK